MAKSSSVYICQNCGYESPKWLGQCPSCSEWNTLEEQVRTPPQKRGKPAGNWAGSAATVVRFSQVQNYDQQIQRLPTGMEEFDRVLGGGVVFGSVVLIGGEPGIGKSTLLTHLTLQIAASQENSGSSNKPVLYVAGEESPEQIALRIERMNPRTQGNWKDQIVFVTSTDVDEICATIEAEKPSLVIIDSIQSMATTDLSGATGSIGQLKESTERLTRIAKRLQVPVFLVGHVTKEGTIAGPKVLEHIVDAVIELSGERTGQYRILRAIKNRFGATDEVGVFEVVEEGLREVTNPSGAFLEDRVKATPGSALVSVVEGTRPLLIEVQALVVRTQLAMPRRVARGIPLQKLQLLCAVLEKYGNLPLGQCDVFVNVAGGMTVTEPAVDLGIAVACVSSFKNTPLPEKTVFVGEVGLLGEIRKVKLLDKRVKECRRLGFSTVIGPSSARSLSQVLSTLARPGT